MLPQPHPYEDIEQNTTHGYIGNAVDCLTQIMKRCPVDLFREAVKCLIKIHSEADVTAIMLRVLGDTR